MTGLVSSLSNFGRKEIEVLFKSTKMRLKKEGLDLRLAPTQKDFGRILIITPKKSGSAPVRNLLKRRLKALFYEEKLYEKRIDVIVYAYKEAAKLTYQDLVRIIKEAFDAYDQRTARRSH